MQVLLNNFVVLLQIYLISSLVGFDRNVRQVLLNHSVVLLGKYLAGWQVSRDRNIRHVLNHIVILVIYLILWLVGRERAPGNRACDFWFYCPPLRDLLDLLAAVGIRARYFSTISSSFSKFTCSARSFAAYAERMPGTLHPSRFPPNLLDQLARTPGTLHSPRPPPNLPHQLARLPRPQRTPGTAQSFRRSAWNLPDRPARWAQSKRATGTP
uniref:(northern house mosquito) hypothetical protein n=1 Tax=Culex pipiens TaxID=7175 RepID=A0A8D8N8A8_CULPI